MTMFKLVLLLGGTTLLASASPADNWPFLLAEKYTDDFRSENEKLEKLAEVYSSSSESQQHGYSTTEYEYNAKTALKEAAHFDFIVIGGGTSGSVLAARLSEIPEWRVLLLEAGNDFEIATKVPHNWESLKNTPYNWAYTTTPQNTSCLAFEDHKCTIPAGRGLGGTSAINSMIYTRGNRRDFDLWADQNNLGWCYSDVLPLYKKIENINFEEYDKYYHHYGGPQSIEHPQYINKDLYHDIKVKGIETIDYNGKHQLGFGVPQLTTFCGRRQSAADSYLKCAIKRPNLIIRPFSQVTKIIIKEHIKEAVGVEYIHEGKLFAAKAEKEIILAAGAIQTPKLLILSGVGPKDECDKHKIPHIVDLKVGHNLRIRPSFIGLDFILPSNNDSHSSIDEYDPYLDYLKNGKGPLTSPGIDAIAYLQAAKDSIQYPDVELQLLQQGYYNYNKFRWAKLSKKYYESIWEIFEHKKSLKMIVTLNHPKSYGYVKLHSNNPLEAPIIEPHFFSDEDDVDFHTLLAGIEKAVELGNKLHLEINEHKIHGCEDLEFGSKYYWKCAMKYLVVPTEDVSGTAKMGPHDEDSYAVVDSHLKVHGIHKLRVADASVIPVPMTGNLMAPSMLIGEKAALLIIDDWKTEV